MHLRLSWLFPSHSCHTQKTLTQLPFPLLPIIPQTSLVFSFLLLHSNISILTTLLFSCSFAPNFSAAILGAISSTVFLGCVFFAQKCCFFVNLQLLICLFVFFLTCSQLTNCCRFTAIQQSCRSFGEQSCQKNISHLGVGTEWRLRRWDWDAEVCFCEVQQ